MIHFYFRGGIMFDLKNTFMFSGMNKPDADNLIKKITPCYKDYARSELIFSPETYDKRIGFVVDGECEVLRNSNGENKVIINILRKNDPFGVLSVFGENNFPTFVFARKKTCICFITDSDINLLLAQSSEVAINFIKFFANRVSYLNSKIETVTMTSVESKLASYLINKAETCGISFSFNFKRCSECISVGRSSVYRAMENLKYAGCISAENKIIRIINKNKLEEFTK